MFVAQLLKNYEHLRALGLTRSKRDYARRWLGRGPTYIRDFESRGREGNLVASITADRLRAHLVEVAARSPRGIAGEIMLLVAEVDRDTYIARTMARWRQ